VKKMITLMFVAVALLSAENQIPEGANQTAPNVYRYTDKGGSSWLYVRTPFGISKREDKPAVPRSSSIEGQTVTVTDLGVAVRFEMKVPFGVSTWVSKKDELTDGEKAMLLGQQLKSQAAAGTVEGKQ